MTRSLLILASLAIGFILSCETVSAQQASLPGQITGIVQGPDGKVIPKAHVSVSTRSKGPVRSRSNAETSSDGSFTLASLAAGSYEVCVQVPGGDLLDPCKWSPTETNVTAGSSTSAGVIQLVAGKLVQVRIADSANLLGSPQSRTSGASVLVGITTADGLFTPMPLQTADSNGRTYGLYVPTDQAVQVNVSGHRLKLSDQNNAAVDPKKGATLQLQPQPGKQTTTYTFSLTGIDTDKP
jgi:hypothetical protein